MAQEFTELVITDAKSERSIVFTKAQHPWRLVITSETDLGGIVQRVIGMEDVAKLSQWLRADPHE